MATKHYAFKSALGYDNKLFNLYKYQIETQKQLLEKIKAILPEHLAEHALHCVLSGKKLTLYTDSAIWSSQLRFYQQTLLHALLSSHTGVIETLQIKIIAPQQSIKSIEKKAKSLPSNENIDFILEQAEYQSDETLKKALLKLGKTFKEKSRQD